MVESSGRTIFGSRREGTAAGVSSADYQTLRDYTGVIFERHSTSFSIHLVTTQNG